VFLLKAENLLLIARIRKRPFPDEYDVGVYQYKEKRQPIIKAPCSPPFKWTGTGNFQV